MAGADPLRRIQLEGRRNSSGPAELQRGPRIRKRPRGKRYKIIIYRIVYTDPSADLLRETAGRGSASPRLRGRSAAAGLKSIHKKQRGRRQRLPGRKRQRIRGRPEEPLRARPGRNSYGVSFISRAGARIRKRYLQCWRSVGAGRLPATSSGLCRSLS